MTLLRTAALFVCISVNAFAAERVETYEDALTRAKASGKDIVVYQRGSDWNRLGERLYADVWQKAELSTALGNDFILVAIDRPEGTADSPTKKLRDSINPEAPLPPCDLTGVESVGGTTYRVRGDGAYLAGGSNPAKDILTLKLTAKSPGSVVRIDFLTDESLPGASAGRGANGNFAIQEIEVSAGATPLKPRAVWASKHHGDQSARCLIDGISNTQESCWNASAHEHESRTVYLVLPKAVASQTQLNLRLICQTNWASHVPGCVRASLLADPILETAVLAATSTEDLKRRNSKFTWRGDDIPRVALLDREGRAVASEDKPRIGLTPDRLATRIKELQKTRLQRDTLWSAANNAQGPARAELLRQSLDLLRLGNSTGHEKAYAFVHDQIKTADPNDESGVQRWLQFSADPRGVPKMVGDALKLVADRKHEEALTAINRELMDPRNRVLDHDRIQRIMLGRFQVYRQWPGNEEKRFEELRKISELDPNTYHGIGAVGYRNMHYRTPQPELVFYGWGAAQVKTGTNIWDLKVCDADYLDHAGKYILRIGHQSGKDTIKVRRVVILMDGRETFSANPNVDLAPKAKIEIPITVTSWNPDRKPIIRFEIEAQDGKTDCSGRFEFEPLLEIASAPIVPVKKK